MKTLITFVVAMTLLVAVAPFETFPCPSNPALTCVMQGLDSPRGLAFGPEGALYVVEAGRGGANLDDPSDGFCCFTGPLNNALSFGRTGAVTRLWEGEQRQIATGLPSIAMPNGNRGLGPHDISFLGRGNAFVTTGLEADPALRAALIADHPEFPEIAGLGGLIHVAASGEWRVVADVSAYERQQNPDGRLNEDGTPAYDSNPFGILAEPGRVLITDAGSNALLQIDASVRTSLLAVFHSRGTDSPRPSFAPPRPPPLPPFEPFTDAVPTAVVAGPDGAYYVSELTGVPFVGGTANIYRVTPETLPRTFLIGDACVSGFKMVVDIAFDLAGNLLVLQHATGAVQQPGLGVLIKVIPDRTQTDICSQYQLGTRTTVLADLLRPTSVVVGPDGAVYVSHNSIPAGRGEVLRILQ